MGPRPGDAPLRAINNDKCVVREGEPKKMRLGQGKSPSRRRSAPRCSRCPCLLARRTSVRSGSTQAPILRIASLTSITNAWHMASSGISSGRTPATCRRSIRIHGAARPRISGRSSKHATRTGPVIVLSSRAVILIGGPYAGELKKAMFTV